MLLQLDANKSPLALLAKTCSSIGVDSPNNKPLNVDKSKDHHNSDRKKNGSSSVNSIVNGDDSSSQSNTTCGSSKLSFKPYEITTKKVNNNFNNNNERNSDNNNVDVVISEKKTPTLKTSSTCSASPKSSGTARTSPLIASSSGKNTPSTSCVSDNNALNKSNGETTSLKTTNTSSASDITSVSNTSLTSTTATSSALSFTSLGLPDMRLDGHKDAINSLSSLSSLAAYKTNPFSSNCCPINGVGPIPHLSLDKTGAYPSIYPPLSYARMKTVNGGQAIMPMCRDPYCGGTCQITAMQNAALLASAAAATCSPSTCPNGCNQCDHQRMLSSLAASAAYSQLNPSLIPGLSQNYGSGLYTPLASGLPRPSGNVCNWIAGDTHCGKRFSSSEELLQHLRTHTSSNAESATSVPSLISPIGSSLAAAAAGCHMHYTTAGTVPPSTMTTTAGLRRTYPTSLSPLSNRYHPYKPAVIPGLGAIPPTVPSLPNLHNSSALNMYYPYGFFTGRIGPPVHP